MKKFALLFTFILFVFILISAAQEKSEWTQIETDDKEVSVSMPSDFLVDTVKKTYDNQSLSLIAFQNKVRMEMLIYDVENPKKSLQELKVDGESKKIGDGDAGFTLKRTSSKDDSQYFATTILLASKTRFYCFIVSAENADEPEISQFLYSIKTRGKAIFINKNADNVKTINSLPVSELKTSPEIAAALNLDTDVPNRKINYEFKKIAPIVNSFNFSRQTPVILVEPFPQGKSYAVSPKISVAFLGQNSGSATFKVNLLSNGKIGDITVYSISDRRILYEFIESIKKIKFLPAVENNKPIDYQWYVTLETDYF